MKLTKRNFIRNINYHYFLNNDTQELLKIECSDEEYLSLGRDNLQPLKEGYIWKQSSQGEVLVDSPTGELGENEYVILEGQGALVVYKNTQGVLLSCTVEPENIVDDEVDTKYLNNY